MAIIKSEYLKLIYHRWIVLTALVTICMVPAFVVFLHETPNKISESYVIKQFLESYYLGQAGVIVISIMYIGQEFVSSALRTSLLTVPNRLKFLFSKLFVLISVIILLWVVITLFTTIITKLYYNIDIIQDIWISTVQISIASISLILICSCLVVLTQSIVLSAGLSLSFLLGLGQMLLQFNNIFLYFPIISTMNLFLPVASSPYLPLVSGLSIQAIWALALLTLSCVMFMRRSIR